MPSHSSRRDCTGPSTGSTSATDPPSASVCPCAPWPSSMGSVLCFFLFLFLFFGLEFVVASIVATTLPSGGASSSGMSLAGTASTASAVSATTFFIFFWFFPPISKGSTTLGRFRTALDARVSSSALSPPSSPSGWFPSLAAVESSTPFSMFRACFFPPCNFCVRRVCAGAGVSGSGAPTPNLNTQEKKKEKKRKHGDQLEQASLRSSRIREKYVPWWPTEKCL